MNGETIRIAAFRIKPGDQEQAALCVFQINMW
jgi:hypothetical protein